MAADADMTMDMIMATTMNMGIIMGMRMSTTTNMGMGMGIIMSMRMSTTMVIIMTTIMHMAAGMTRVNRNPLPCPDTR